MNNFLQTIWGTRTAKAITILGSMLIAIFGTITAAHTAFPIMEPAMPAHRQYVRDYVDGRVDKVQATTNDLLIWKFEDNRDRAKSEAEDKAIMLQKEADPQVRSLIQQNINASVEKQKDYEARIQKLKGQ